MKYTEDEAFKSLEEEIADIERRNKFNYDPDEQLDSQEPVFLDVEDGCITLIQFGKTLIDSTAQKNYAAILEVKQGEKFPFGFIEGRQVGNEKKPSAFLTKQHNLYSVDKIQVGDIIDFRCDGLLFYFVVQSVGKNAVQGLKFDTYKDLMNYKKEVLDV